MLSAGIKGHGEMTVQIKDTAKSVESGLMDVYATPALIALMEKTAFTSVNPLLNEGCGSVGIHIEVDHLAASAVGAHITCESELTAVEGRKLIFAIEAYDESGLIAKAKHERFVVEIDKFMEKASKKLK